LANRTTGNLKDRAKIARHAVRRIRKQHSLAKGFLHKTNLFF
jgi:hypothetical protein